MIKDKKKITHLPFCKGVDRYQILWLPIVSASEHDNSFHVMYVDNNTTTQSRNHGGHLLNFFLGEVITTNLHSLMKLPMQMHILDNSSKDSTDTYRNIIFISETNLLICLELLRSQKLRIMSWGWQLWQLVLFQLLQKQCNFFLGLH